MTDILNMYIIIIFKVYTYYYIGTTGKIHGEKYCQGGAAVIRKCQLYNIIYSLNQNNK